MAHIAIFTFPLLGHARQLISLSAELRARGHQVSFAIPEPGERWLEDSGCTVVPWSPSSAGRPLGEAMRAACARAAAAASVWEGERIMTRAAAEAYDSMFASSTAILRRLAPEYVVVDRAALAVMDAAMLLRIPFAVQSRYLGHYAPHLRGSPRFPTPFPRRMDWWQRAMNRAAPLAAAWFLLPTYVRLNRRRVANGACARAEDLLAGRLILVGSGPPLEIERALPPRVVLTGPILPRTPAPLSAELARWLDDAREVVYVSFGTLAHLGEARTRIVCEGLAATGRAVLWSTPDPGALAGRGFRVESSVPQEAVLAHPSVRLFVSHCGMNGVIEGLTAGKPFLSVPMFGDQFYNAARVADLGAGTTLGKDRLSARGVRTAALALLETGAARSAAEDAGRRLRAQPGRARAADLIEADLAAATRPRAAAAAPAESPTRPSPTAP